MYVCVYVCMHVDIHTTDAGLRHGWIIARQQQSTRRVNKVQQTIHSVIIQCLQPSTHSTHVLNSSTVKIIM